MQKINRDDYIKHSLEGIYFVERPDPKDTHIILNRQLIYVLNQTWRRNPIPFNIIEDGFSNLEDAYHNKKIVGGDIYKFEDSESLNKYVIRYKMAQELLK